MICFEIEEDDLVGLSYSLLTKIDKIGEFLVVGMSTM